MYTHGSCKQMVTFKILLVLEGSPKGKPRGVDNITPTIALHVAKGTKVVFDNWLGTAAAAKPLPHTFPPRIRHTLDFRDRRYS